MPRVAKIYTVKLIWFLLIFSKKKDIASENIKAKTVKVALKNGQYRKCNILVYEIS